MAEQSFGQKSAGFAGRAAQTAANPQGFWGRAFKRGTMESFGFYHEGTVNKGFLGLGKSNRMAAARAFGRAGGGAAGGKAAAGKLAGGALGGALILGTGLYATYQGYKEGGLWGGAKAVAEHTAYGVAWHVGAGIVGAGVAGAATAVAGIGAAAYGYYRFGEAAQEHRKRVTGLEMGSPSVDLLNGTGALTARARAMNALNNSHLNGRIAIGNEALLTHTSYR